MPETTVKLQSPIPSELAPELARRLYFVSDEILDFTLIHRGGDVTAVRVNTDPRAATTDLDRKIRMVAQQDVMRQRAIEPKVRWSAPARPLALEEPFAAMLACGAAAETGEGLVALGTPMIGLVDYLDRRLRDLAVARLGGVEYRYPTLIRTDVLSRCGYLGSFPQHLMFVTRLHTDVDVYEQFVREVRDAGATAEILNHCRNADYSLPPTMCFHTYHQLAGTTIPAGGQTFTACGKSFRFESRYRRGLERLWDFTIRETVFVGLEDYVLDCRDSFLEAAVELVQELDMAGRCEVASDPFFLGDSAVKAWAQRMHELKYELILSVGGGREVSVGSFNFHERFFGEAFGILDGDSSPTHTACVGFGLERFALAFVARHGLDPAVWPVEV